MFNISEVGFCSKMSGPYLDGLGQRKRKYSESSNSEDGNSDFFSVTVVVKRNRTKIDTLLPVMPK